MQPQDTGSTRYNPFVWFIITLFGYGVIAITSIQGGCGAPPGYDCNSIYDVFTPFCQYVCVTSFCTLLIIALAWPVQGKAQSLSPQAYGKVALPVVAGLVMLLGLLGVFSDWAGLAYTIPPVMPYFPPRPQLYTRADVTGLLERLCILPVFLAGLTLLWPPPEPAIPTSLVRRFGLPVLQLVLGTALLLILLAPCATRCSSTGRTSP